MASKDYKVSVIVITDNGIEFKGIYSDMDDARTTGAMFAHRGKVILSKFDLTSGEYLSEDRGMYMSSPELEVFPEVFNTHLQ